MAGLVLHYINRENDCAQEIIIKKNVQEPSFDMSSIGERRAVSIKKIKTYLNSLRLEIFSIG